MDKDLDFEDEEIEETEGEESHLKGALIAVLVIVIICSLIILSIVLLSPNKDSDDLNVGKYEINEILNNEFKPKLFNGTWISGHEFIYKDMNESLVIFNARNNSISSIVVQSYITRQYEVQKFSLSSDKEFILLTSKHRKSIDFVFTANFIVYDITNGNIIHLENILENESKISIEWAEWAPNGNALIFVYNNDIYYIPYIGAKVKTITNTGKTGIVFNGIPDLLYREKISSKESMLWWSKDGSNLCYATIDNTGVKDNIMVLYGNGGNGGNGGNYSKSDSLQLVYYKYPKAQQIISKTSLWVYNSNTSLINQIIPPKRVSNEEFYVTFVNWITSDLITVFWTLKNQSNSIVSTCSASEQWICKEIIKISNDLNLKKMSQNIISTDDGMNYFMIALRPDTKFGNYYQISSFRLDEKFIESFITHVVDDVSKLLFFDKLSQSLYFEVKQSMIVERQHLYRVNVTNKSFECISCRYPFTDCHYFEAIFSPTAEYYIVQCLGPNIPRVYVFKLDEHNKWFEFQGNEELKNKLKTKVYLKHQIFAVNRNKKTYIKLLLPLEFDNEVVNKYPLIIETNNPENKILTEEWSIGWSHYLVSKHQFIYGWVESDDQNRRHRKQSRNYEAINENIESIRIGVKHIKDNLLFIDTRRMCIWGSNVAAFVAISGLASTDVLNCAVLVAPVLNFKLTDVVTYHHFFNGWNSVFDTIGIANKMSKLIAKHILLIHGSSDEKVSVQHSMQFIKQLIDEYSRNGWNSGQPLLQVQIYPDSDNSLESMRHHMFQRIQLFFEQIFCKYQ